jgi:hypothetical protein
MPDESDDGVRALFHRIDDGPPLDIDVREVMARGRQIRTRRTRLAVAGSALAVAAAATLVGVSIGGDANAPDMFRPAVSSTQPPTTGSTTSPEQPFTSPSVPVTAPENGDDSPPGPVPGATAPNTNSPPAPGAGVPSSVGRGSG